MIPGYRCDVKFGLFAINFGTCADPEVTVEVARAAEAAGFESVWSGEHLVLPDPRPPGGPFPSDLPLLDTTVALTLVAAHTTTLRVGSGIIVLPLRNPVVLAKELASLDVVSGGRLLAGFGVGYIDAEFQAVGVPRSERQNRMDEYLRALRALWTMPSPQYEGRFCSFSGIDARPRPMRAGGPPMIVGGEGPKAFARAVSMANGWYGFDPDDLSGCLDGLRDAASAHERPEELGRLEITVTPTGPLDRAVVEHYAELGVDRLVVLPDPDAASADKHRPVPRDEILRNIERISTELIDR